MRFKRLADVPLAVVAETIRRVPAKDYIARYEQGLADRRATAKKPRAKLRNPRRIPGVGFQSAGKVPFNQRPTSTRGNRPEARELRLDRRRIGVQRRCLIKHAGWIAACEKPVAPSRETRPCRIAPDIHAPQQGGDAPQHQIAQGDFRAPHHRIAIRQRSAARQVIMARVKAIFAQGFQPMRHAFKRRAGCRVGAGRHTSGEPSRCGTQ